MDLRQSRIGPAVNMRFDSNSQEEDTRMITRDACSKQSSKENKKVAQKTTVTKFVTKAHNYSRQRLNSYSKKCSQTKHRNRPGRKTKI